MRRSITGFALFSALAFPVLAAAQASAKPAEAPPITARAPRFFAGIGIGPGSFRFSCPDICTGEASGCGRADVWNCPWSGVSS
jgi:hypothetical protein